MPTPPRPATIVHIGAFDLASYGDQIFPLVAATELRRRLGEVELLPFGPVGSVGDAAGADCWALGPWTPARAAELARRATLVLCGGGEIVQGDGSIYAPFYGIDPRDGDELRIDRWFVEVLGAAEADCPVVWHAPGVPLDLDDDAAARVRAAAAGRALVAVRDELSRARLEAAGVERPVDVVPDSAFLLPRVLPAAQLAGRRDELRAAGQYPPDGPVVVVQGNSTMRGLVPDLAKALTDLVPEARVATVAVSPCHDDGRFARELAAAVGGRTWSVPDDAPLESTAAAIAGADCFLGVSLHGAITARAYGRPHVTFDPFGQAKLSGLADLLDSQGSRAGDAAAAVEMVRARLAEGADATPGTERIAARVDDQFDGIAELAQRRRESMTEPVTWSDTATPLHLRLRRPPRRVDPVAETPVAGLRRPDILPTDDDLRTTLATTLASHQARRAEAAEEHAELVRLRAENGDLRGALGHLEGTERHAAELEARVARTGAEFDRVERERDELARAIDAARGSRVFRLTGRPAALREVDRPQPGDHGSGA